MTRKHYELIAAVLADEYRRVSGNGRNDIRTGAKVKSQRALVLGIAHKLADTFVKADNRFSRGKFMADVIKFDVVGVT